MNRQILSALLLVITLTPGLLWAQSATGTISGKVVDGKTGEPLWSANVLLKGTGLGAPSDAKGSYVISNVPPGTYTLRVSYIGYRESEVEVTVDRGSVLTHDFKLEPVGIVGAEVVVTAQASGQNAAINQQLASQNIVNVVSAARIKELPDANAAESIGRLPGVFLVRSYGEGSQIAIRGLEPKYNLVLIDGVPMPASSSGDRSVDLSMISSDMLSGIEIYKTVTPDMDAAVLGGTVNFRIREAPKTPEGQPALNLSAQGGYDDLTRTYNDYKFTASVGQRYFGDKLGLLAEGVIERRNLTADIFGGGYYQKDKSNFYLPFKIYMNSLTLSYKPTDKRRYDGIFVADYKWDNGSITFSNTLSKSTQVTQTFNQNYGVGDNSSITYDANYFNPTNNVITNILSLQQDVLSFNVHAKVSHGYTESINPGYWGITFTLPGGGGVGSIPADLDPQSIARLASTKIDFNNTILSGVNTNSSFTRQRNLEGSLDAEKGLSLSDAININFKFGGNFRYTFRSYDYSSGSGTLQPPGNTGARQAVVAAFPWMAQAPYNMKADGTTQFPIAMFFNTAEGFGNFLKGDYPMVGHPMNMGLLEKLVDIVTNYQRDKPYAVSNSFSPDALGDIANDYSGHENRSAGYLMATVNIGSDITFIPGVRYQGLQTVYSAPHVPAAYQNNTYPYPFPHTDTTTTEYHGYWLPDVSLRYKPLPWLDARLSYTNTLTYPDFNDITPLIEIGVNSVTWNNYLLKPARSQNFDLSISAYANEIGLLTVAPFLKRISDLIFTSNVFITDPSLYPGLPPYTNTYALGTQVNNPNRVDLWGVETDWQTHFWYLPDPLSGLVLNVNYTHIFSGAKYPFVITKTVGSFPFYKTVHVDTTYTDRLIDQPSNIVNLSVGYDYKAFSVVVSMVTWADVFTGTSFWPAFRAHKATYTRWDLTAKQGLPWHGLELYLNLQNLNSEPDINVIQGNGYPSSENSYGLRADFGLRWKL